MARAYLCGFASVQKSLLELSYEGYVASAVPVFGEVADEGAVSKGPGNDTPGGVTIRPSWCTTVLTSPKCCGLSEASVHGVGDYPWMTRGVLGDFAWGKWCNWLTDEGPRRSPSFMEISAIYKAVPK